MPFILSFHFIFCSNNHVLYELHTKFKCSAPFGKVLSVVSSDLISAAVYTLKCTYHDLQKAGIEAGSDRQHGLVKIAPSSVSKAI